MGIVDYCCEYNIICFKKVMEQEKKCSKCKKGFSKKQWYMVFLSIYVLFATVYGTIKLVGDIVKLF